MDMNTTQRKETELFRIELNTIVSNKPGRNILKKKQTKSKKLNMSVPVNWEKKRARTDSNKAIDAQIYLKVAACLIIT